MARPQGRQSLTVKGLAASSKPRCARLLSLLSSFIINADRSFFSRPKRCKYMVKVLNLNSLDYIQYI